MLRPQILDRHDHDGMHRFKPVVSDLSQGVTLIQKDRARADLTV